MSTGTSLLKFAPSPLDEGWVELEPLEAEEDEANPRSAVGLIDTWVRTDPVDELLAELKAHRLQLSEAQAGALFDILTGWRPEEEILSDRRVQQGIEEAIREFERWKNSL